MTPESWEIWWAWFRFDDAPDRKRRPVLVLDPQRLVVLCLKVTSHEARDVFGEYEIIHWQYAHLPKPSTIRTTQMQELDYSSFDRKIGELHPEDIRLIRRFL